MTTPIPSPCDIFKANSKMNYLPRVGVIILVLVGLGGMAWLERVPSVEVRIVQGTAKPADVGVTEFSPIRSFLAPSNALQ